MDKYFTEHHNRNEGEYIPYELLPEVPAQINFRGNPEYPCVQVDAHRKLSTRSFVGTDWLTRDQAIYVAPKFSSDGRPINYLSMLYRALNHPEVWPHADDLVEIKFEKPPIAIKPKDDMLTPLLVGYFIRILQDIVQKGLKKSYYKIHDNLHSKVKGKVMVSETVKQNQLRNKTLHTWCRYDEFGVNNLENRLLKKALLFVSRYLTVGKLHKRIEAPNLPVNLAEQLSGLLSAFQHVQAEVSLKELRHHKPNPLYKEYDVAIRLAKRILRRYGYSISNITAQQQVKTPPFWIDMSKLFELYVLALLKNRYGRQVTYHFTAGRRELDYLLKIPQYPLVVDAKYKRYATRSVDIEDIRQISAYARMKGVYQETKHDMHTLIPALIIYPDMDNGYTDFQEINLHEAGTPLKPYVQFYKLGVKLPLTPR